MPGSYFIQYSTWIFELFSTWNRFKFDRKVLKSPSVKKCLVDLWGKYDGNLSPLLQGASAGASWILRPQKHSDSATSQNFPLLDYRSENYACMKLSFGVHGAMFWGVRDTSGKFLPRKVITNQFLIVSLNIYIKRGNVLELNKLLAFAMHILKLWSFNHPQAASIYII